MIKYKRHISVVFLLIVINYISAQNVIEIEVDSIHCQDSTCYLLNFSDDRIYSCSFLSLELAEYRFFQTIDCTDRCKLNYLGNSTNSLDLKKIRTIEHFKSWVSCLKFASNFTYNSINWSQQYQSLSESYGVIRSVNLEADNSNKPKIETYQIIPIRVNDEYYIAGLIGIDDYEVDHLIFPENNKTGMMHYLNRIYEPTFNSFEIDQSKLYKDIYNTYKVRYKRSKKVLTNSISTDPILTGEYDDIILEYPYVVTKRKGSVNVYNAKLQDITPNNLMEAYGSFGSLQLIIDNEVKWMNSDGVVVDTMPEIERVLGCGNVACEEKSIMKSNGEFIEIINDCDYSFYEKNSVTDSIVFDINRNLDSLLYLNNKTKRVFSVDCFMQFYCNPLNLYYFKTKENTKGIFKRVNVKQEIIDQIWANKSLSHQERWKQVKSIRDTLKATYRDEILLEGLFEDIILSDYNKPIIFKDKGRYGVFPLMGKAKYKSIKPFVGNLAEVVFGNNEEGWIDLKGNEIKKKGN